MRKPEGWDNTQAAYMGESEKLEPGGYILRIVQVKMAKSKSGRDMLILAYDIHEGEHTNFFSRMHERRKKTNQEAKWPGRYFQLTDGDSMKFFKGLIDIIEKSNAGYKWDWNESSLVGKFIGGLFGEEEYLNQNNQITVSCKLQFVKTTGDIMNGNYIIPELKKMKSTLPQGASSFGTQSYADDEIPF